jgi:hypothetical protein
VGTNVIAFIVSFAMLAMFFFTALYMQNILGYSAIEAGRRFLPSTLMIVLIAPLAGRLTGQDRPAAAARDRPDPRDVRAVPSDADRRAHRLRPAAAPRSS